MTVANQIWYSSKSTWRERLVIAGVTGVCLAFAYIPVYRQSQRKQASANASKPPDKNELREGRLSTSYAADAALKAEAGKQK
mmetsp:Transcript_18452/g.30722  ORF Transcript_18452/g.30722 Transcript_18452/m.30722 type:complete len:82 (-) Transcript_18452:438-683(-)